MLNEEQFLNALRFDKNSDVVLYRKLAERIETAIQRGDLRPGDKLPTQRRIAQHLDLNLSTVMQAFKTLRSKRLVTSRTGSGSFVAPAWVQGSDQDYPSAPQGPNVLDLTVNRPATQSFLDSLTPLLKRLPDDERYFSLQDYQLPNGALWARQAIADWLVSTRVLPDVDVSDLIITQGAQHALACVLQAITRPGDVVLADAITYQGVTALCHTLNLTIRGVEMDDQGMIPDSLDAACRKHNPQALILIPTLHNPTAITLSADRRRKLATIAARHNVTLIEDDVYRWLYDKDLTTLYALEPENTYYIGGFSKMVAPGLRIGFVLAPPGQANPVSTALRINTWCVSPLNMLIATKLLENGEFDVLLTKQLADIRQRQAVVKHHLGRFDIVTYPTSTHTWLKLPLPWTTSQFLAALRTQRVSVLGSDMFAVERQNVPHAIRLNIAAPRSHHDLDKALSRIAQALDAPDSYFPGAF